MGSDSLGWQRHCTGSCSELMVSGYLQRQGKDVFLPQLKKTRCDLIYLDGNRPVRAQVKTGTITRTGPHLYEQVRLRSRDKPLTYGPEEIDELWVVGTNLWRIPAEVVASRTSLYLRTDNPDPRQNRRDYNVDSFVEVHGTFLNPYRDRLT